MLKRLFFSVMILALGLSAAVPAAPARKSREEQEVERILASIKGKEKLPAGEVFKNVKLLTNVPAERFLRIMQQSYSKALGVSCDHCHVEDFFESDEKRPKVATREMIELVTAINRDLQKMKH